MTPSPEADSPRPAPSGVRRGIYLLPNLFTTGGLFAGYFAIVSAINGRYAVAAIAVFVAALLDGIDGRVARMTNTQSEFGVQYDSLADLVSFGLAPSLVMYTWSLDTLSAYGPVWTKVGWAAAFLYAACAALRLARFNTQVGTTDKRYFIGLASPAAAGLMMSFVWSMADLDIDGFSVVYLSLTITIVAALLMVSRVRYWSFKAKPQSDRVPYLLLVMVVLAFALLAVFTERALLGITAAYALSGPLFLVFRRRRDPVAPA